jgi:hypothetical protein
MRALASLRLRHAYLSKSCCPPPPTAQESAVGLITIVNVGIRPSPWKSGRVVVLFFVFSSRACLNHPDARQRRSVLSQNTKPSVISPPYKCSVSYTFLEEHPKTPRCWGWTNSEGPPGLLREQPYFQTTRRVMPYKGHALLPTSSHLLSLRTTLPTSLLVQ